MMRLLLKNSCCFILLLCLVATSCNRFSIDIAHRKYRHGFYVDFSSRNNTSKNGHIADRAVSKKQESVKEKPTGESALSPLHFDEPVSLSPQSKANNDKVAVPLTAARTEKQENKIVAAGPNNKTILFQAPDNNKTKNTNAFYFLATITGLLSAGLFSANRKRAFKISQWSAKNPKRSRGLQAMGHIVLALGSFITGSMLFRHEMVATPATATFFTSVFLGTLAVYPVRKKGHALLESTYRKIKLTDIVLILSGAMMCSTLGNQVAAERSGVSTQSAKEQIRVNEHMIGFTPAQNFIAMISSGADRLDDALFNTSERSSGEKLSGAQIALLILVPISFGILTLFLAVLSCAISCEGNGGLAVLVLVFGLALLILLSIVATKGVLKLPGKKEPELKSPE